MQIILELSRIHFCSLSQNCALTHQTCPTLPSACYMFPHQIWTDCAQIWTLWCKSDQILVLKTVRLVLSAYILRFHFPKIHNRLGILSFVSSTRCKINKSHCVLECDKKYRICKTFTFKRGQKGTLAYPVINNYFFYCSTLNINRSFS